MVLLFEVVLLLKFGQLVRRYYYSGGTFIKIWSIGLVVLLFGWYHYSALESIDLLAKKVLVLGIDLKHSGVLVLVLGIDLGPLEVLVLVLTFYKLVLLTSDRKLLLLWTACVSQ